MNLNKKEKKSYEEKSIKGNYDGWNDGNDSDRLW